MAEVSTDDASDPDILRQLQAHLPIAREIAEERNRYIHDLWVFDAGLVAAGRIRRYRPRFEKPEKSAWSELTIADIDAFGEKLLAIQDPFAKAVQKLRPGFLNTPGD